MSFIRLLLAEMGPAHTRLLLSIAISGLAMGWIIVLVNSLADLQPGAPHFQLIGQFALAAVLAVWFRMQALGFTNSVCESMTDRLRRRFVALACRADILGLEALGPANLLSAVARDSATLSEAAPGVIQAIVPFIAFLVASFYIASLSILAFIVVLGLLAANIRMALAFQRALPKLHGAARQAETSFFEAFEHLLEGRKEVRMSAARADALEHEYLARWSGRLSRRGSRQHAGSIGPSACRSPCST
jgi:putative ATP-binding cassette transporter